MLDVINVSCGYRGVDVIHNINFSVDRGNNICIVGPNGCGKSTLLKSIANLIEFNGEILLDKESLTTLSPKKRATKVAIMSQLGSIYFPYSTYDTVSIGRYAYLDGVFSSLSEIDKNIIDDCLKNVGIFDLKDKLISELSGGQLQRVFLARVFAQNPDVILLDEPTNHLDLSCQIELLEYLSRWSKENNKIVVCVLHDLNLVQYFAQYVLLLNKGETVLQGNPKEVLTSKILKDIYGIDIRSFMLDVLEKWKDGN